MSWISKRGVHTGRWSWIAPRRPCCAHLRVVLPSAPEAIPTRWEGLLHQAKTGFKNRLSGFGQLASTDIPSLANLDDAGSLLTDLPFAHCDYDDDTVLTQATWPSPKEHAPDAPPCPHIAPSRPVTSRSTCAFTTLCVALGFPTFSGLESHSNIIFISKPGGVTRPVTTTTTFLIIWSTGSRWGTYWEICHPKSVQPPICPLLSLARGPIYNDGVRRLCPLWSFPQAPLWRLPN